MIDTDKIRTRVATGAEPLADAARVVGAMLDVITGLYGREVAESLIRKLHADLPPQPNHAATEL